MINVTSTIDLDNNLVFEGSSFQNLIKLASSHYNTELDAFYELIKNIEDQDAHEISAEFDCINKRIILFGDGIGIEDSELKRIQKNAGKSIKDDSHHGIGLYCFLKISSRLIFISKQNKQHYIMSMTPHPGGKHIYSDVGAPHKMSRSECITYGEYLSKISKYRDGTIYILEDVGVQDNIKTNIASTFDMKKVFSKKSYINFLRDKCNYSLKVIRFFVKTERSEKPERIDAKAGRGSVHRFSVPSNKCPYPKEKTVFWSKGREFELSLKCELWISNSNKGIVVITEDHKNALPIDSAYGSCQKLNHKQSVFRGDPLGQYLEGEISFSVFAKDGGGSSSYYTGARSHLMLNNSFGDTLSNMIITIERDMIRPLLIDFEETQHNKMSKKLNKQYDDLVNGFFDEYSFDALLVHSTGPVINNHHKRKCTLCGRKLDLSIVNKLPNLDFKINRIFLCGDGYTCGICRGTWPKEQRKNTSENKKVPIYKPPKLKEGAERKKKHGLGISMHLRPLAKGDTRRSMYELPSTVVINTDHIEYKKLNKNSSQSRTLVLRNIVLTFREIIDFRMKDESKDHLGQLEEMFSNFCIWFNEQKKRR